MPKQVKKPVRTTCPECGANQGQVRNGKNPSGSKRIYCKNCGRHYTCSPKRTGYGKDKFHEVLHDYAMTRLKQLTKKDHEIPITIPYPDPGDAVFRKVARRHKVHHQTVKKWVLKWYESGKSFDQYLYPPNNP